MTQPRALQRPVLVPHARYRWDEIRGQHQLVFPEGMLVLNETSAAVVQYCDGRPLNELVQALQAAYDDCDPEEVTEFLATLYKKGLARDAAAA